MHTDKLDFERLKGQEVNGTALYSRKDSDMWRASPGLHQPRVQGAQDGPSLTLTLTLTLT